MNNKAIEKIIVECFTPLYNEEIDTNAKSFMLKTKRHKVPDEKINAAIREYANDVNKEDIVLYIDSTLFGKGNEGIIMTTDKLYYNATEKRGKGVINLFDITFCRVKSSFWSTSTRIEAAGKSYELGQIVSLAEPNRRLERGIDNLIEALKNYDDLDENLLECFKKLYAALQKNNRDNLLYLRGYSSQEESAEKLVIVQPKQNTLCIKNKKMFVNGKEVFEIKNLKRVFLDDDEKQLTFYTEKEEFSVTLDGFSEDELELLQDSFDELIMLLKK